MRANCRRRRRHETFHRSAQEAAAAGGGDGTRASRMAATCALPRSARLRLASCRRRRRTVLCNMCKQFYFRMYLLFAMCAGLISCATHGGPLVRGIGCEELLRPKAGPSERARVTHPNDVRHPATAAQHALSPPSSQPGITASMRSLYFKRILLIITPSISTHHPSRHKSTHTSTLARLVRLLRTLFAPQLCGPPAPVPAAERLSCPVEKGYHTPIRSL